MSPSADASAFRTRVDDAIATFVARQRGLLEPLGDDAVGMVDAAADFLAGGKRLRPEFCRAGWVAAGGDPDDAQVATAAAAFEWLQGSALVHDDLMDGSDTRRGRPSVHRAFEALHRDRAAEGDAAQFGLSVAVLLGDLMLSWSDEMLRGSALPRVPQALAYFDLCKTEVTTGQLLDVTGATRLALTVDEAMTVVRFKAAKYTVERPLHVGAALAGADPDLVDALSRFALPLGEAFQLRDDVLGVFGDPAETGKPAGDDLREGKRTVLVARTLELADDAGRELVRHGLGSSDHVDALRDLIASCGALEAVERDIREREDAAQAALAAFDAPGRALLEDLALRATRRTR